MKDDFLKLNLEILSKRFPDLFERISGVDISRIETASAADGGICYVVKNDSGQFVCVSNPNDPIQSAQRSITAMQHRLTGGLSPAVVVGLAPGYLLDTVYSHFNSRLKFNEPFRHIYVIVDSLICLAAWLGSTDRREVLLNEAVTFYWHKDVWKIVTLCENDLQRSHLFIPVSELPENIVNKIIEPLAVFYIRREDETKKLLAANNEYYDSMDDLSLARIIGGGAGRKPRLMMPTHASSTVVQYSTRDTSEAFKSLGWETFILSMEKDLSPWRMAKAINDFKPDLFIFINHLRTEDEKVELYPHNMLFITWIQDTMPLVNRRSSAEKWNRSAEGGNRDFMIGYTDQLKKYGYEEKRLFPCGMIVNTDIFNAKEISEEERLKYACDVCFASNRSRTPEDMLSVLIAHYETYGFTAKTMHEVYDRLKRYYDSGETITSCDSLRLFLLEAESFKKQFEKLDADQQDNMIERIFWELNDVIYRNVVLRWIAAMDGVTLNIYGKDWDKNPEFRKYAKGVVSHGAELSKAYRAARYCLHLNAMEGSHQRLLEITASGGIPIWRSNSKTILLSSSRKTLFSAFLKLFKFKTGGKVPISSITDILENWEWDELSEFILGIAFFIIHKYPDMERDIFLKKCMEKLRGYLVPQVEWFYTEWERLCFTNKDELAGILARRDVETRSSEIGLYHRQTAVSFIEHIVLTLNEESFSNILNDAVLNSEICAILDFAVALNSKNTSIEQIDISFAQIRKLGDKFKSVYIPRLALLRLDKAIILSSEGKIEEALAETALVLKYDSAIQDAYSRVVWFFYAPQQRFKELLPWMRLDFENNRMSSSWNLKYLQVLAKEGYEGEAECLVTELYRNDSDFKGAYTSIASGLFSAGKYEKSLEYSQWEISVGRISNATFNDLAKTLLILDHTDEAEKLIIENNLNAGQAAYAVFEQYLLSRIPEPDACKLLNLAELDLKREAESQFSFFAEIAYSFFLKNADRAKDALLRGIAKYPDKKSNLIFRYIWFSVTAGKNLRSQAYSVIKGISFVPVTQTDIMILSVIHAVNNDLDKSSEYLDKLYKMNKFYFQIPANWIFLSCLAFIAFKYGEREKSRQIMDRICMNYEDYRKARIIIELFNSQPEYEGRNIPPFIITEN